MVAWRGTARLRGGAYAFSPERPSAVPMLGWVGHRTGDRDCEPAQLTEHQATVALGMGGKLGGSPAYRAPEPRHGRPWRGFVIPERGNDAERLGISKYCGEVPKLGDPSDRTACQEEIGKYGSIIGNARCTASKTAWQTSEGTAREIVLNASGLHLLLPQSSASRFTARCCGFLLLTKCRERPER
jgi:hypothetical protein